MVSFLMLFALPILLKSVAGQGTLKIKINRDRGYHRLTLLSHLYSYDHCHGRDMPYLYLLFHHGRCLDLTKRHDHLR
jgi:hypothetical protein